MTHEEAVKKLKANEERRIQLTYFVIKDMAIKALEKQIPRQLDYEGDGYGDDGELVYDIARCQICEHCFEYNINDWGSKYCPDCGQALDWGDNDGKEG